MKQLSISEMNSLTGGSCWFIGLKCAVYFGATVGSAFGPSIVLTAIAASGTVDCIDDLAACALA